MKKISKVKRSPNKKNLQQMKRLSRSPKTQQMAVNALHSIYLKVCDLPNDFREKVCEECDYSVPTFYRKMKEPAALSNAEREKIVSIAEERIEGLKKFAEMFKKKSA